MKRGVVWLLAALVCATLMAPAVLFDAALRHLSDGRLRLASPQGSIWRGEGWLAATDGHAALARWAQVSWRFERSGLGGLGWALALDGVPAARAMLRLEGIVIDGLALDLPVGPLAESVPHPLARAGWGGRLRLHGQGLRCDWRGVCRGGGELTLEGVRTAILPGGQLGDYRATLALSERTQALRVSSAPHSRLRLDGRSERDAAGRVLAGFDLSGESELMRVLPGLLHGVARAQADGSLRIDWPPP